MNQRIPNPVAPRTSALTRIAFVAVALVAAIVHGRAAQMRSSGLLEHDESISLLEAAGSAPSAEELYQAHPARVSGGYPAESLQTLLRPMNDCGFGCVTSALRQFDIHPPLYFWLLNAAERLGIHSMSLLRMLGSFLLLAAAILLDRLVWPQSNQLVRILAFALILLSPSLVGVATELRQYALLLPGFALSVAAVVQLSQMSSRWTRGAAQIAIAPVLLIWTHFGMVVWLAIWSLLLMVLAWRGRRPQRLAVAAGFAVAAVFIAPLFVVYAGMLAQRSAATHGGALSPLTAVCDILAGSAELLVALPWSIRATWVEILPMLGAIAMAVWLVRRRPFADKLLLAAAAIWMIGWAELLSLGKLPPHAVQPKYLVVPAIAGLAVVVRCGTATVGRPGLRIVVLALAGMLLLNFIELPASLRTPPDARVAASLHGVQALIVNDPKRGYLFPIVEKLPPSARVYVAQSMMQLPGEPDALGDPLLVLEIKPAPNYPSSAYEIRLNELLKTQYEQCELLADGPRRKLTLYSDRRN